LRKPDYFVVGLLLIMGLLEALISGFSLIILTSLALILVVFAALARGLVWEATYLGMGLGLFYGSLSFYSLAVIPALAVALLWSVSYKVNYSSGSGVLGNSSLALLGPLPFFLIASIANPRLFYVVGLFALSVLAVFVYRYVIISHISISNVEFPTRVIVGEPATVRIVVSSPVPGFVEVSVGDTSEVFRVFGSAHVSLTLRFPGVGRQSFILRVTASDSWLVARRLVHESMFSVIVLPSYSYLARKYERLFGSLPSDAFEPVNTRLFFLSGGAALGTGQGAADHILRSLPKFLRGVARSLIQGLLISSYTGVSGVGSGRGVFGEYYGSREFVSGDLIKLINWKKSLSTRRLVVKEFVTGESAGVSSSIRGKYAPVIVADLTTSGFGELDRLLGRLIRLMASAAKHSPEAGSLTILVFGDLMIAIEGPVSAVFSRLAQVIADIVPPVIYDYDYSGLIHRFEDARSVLESRDCCQLVKAVAESGLSYAKSVAATILKYGLLPPKKVAMIYGASASLRNSILANMLMESGYEVSII